MTIGADRPPYGTRHRKFSPFSFQLLSRPVSLDTPSRASPRISGQSPGASTPRGGACPWTTSAPSPRAVETAMTRKHFFSIGFLCISQIVPLPLRDALVRCLQGRIVHRSDVERDWSPPLGSCPR